jgi:cytochrome d ubiquinol oxidase subunit I
MNTLTLSRLQFAVTTVFHMLWPLLSIGISLAMVVMEILWLKTRQDEYYRQVRFWSKIFLVAFGIGVASGVPLEFQFGTNWSRFAIASGDLFGNILAFEASMSFALEAAFLAVFIFGWNRVSRSMHLFSNIMVAFGASLSAFWIMGANSWMQVPAGVKYAGGKIVITDYLRAVFNPGLPVAFSHIWFASVETSLFFMAGISAWYILRKRNVEFFLKAFKIALIMGIAAAPLQIFLGDQSGLSVLTHQPAKAAAMEAWWSTNPPGTSAPWSVVAWPDKAVQGNRFSLDIPYALSLLATRRLTGQVTGLRNFPVDEQPPVALPYYAFRLMVLLGFFMLGLVIWAAVQWARGRLKPENAAGRTLLWKFWLYALPAGFIATESGWVLREVGRQPWIIYGLMRTADGVSPVAAGSAAATLAIFSAAYLALLVLFIVFLRRILDKGPDLSSPIPRLSAPPGASGAAGGAGR